jgi:hypothetical protein
MEEQFGTRPEPWLSEDDSPEIAIVDFDGSASGIAHALPADNSLPETIGAQPDAPIVRARNKAVTAPPPSSMDSTEVLLDSSAVPPAFAFTPPRAATPPPFPARTITPPAGTRPPVPVRAATPPVGSPAVAASTTTDSAPVPMLFSLPQLDIPPDPDPAVGEWPRGTDASVASQAPRNRIALIGAAVVVAVIAIVTVMKLGGGSSPPAVATPPPVHVAEPVAADAAPDPADAAPDLDSSAGSAEPTATGGSAEPLPTTVPDKTPENAGSGSGSATTVAPTKPHDPGHTPKKKHDKRPKGWNPDELFPQ